jgi:hypothetical protein
MAGILSQLGALAQIPGLSGYMQQKAMNDQGSMQNLSFGMKMAEIQQAQAEAQRKAMAAEAFKQQFPQLAGLMDVNPQLATQRAFPEAPRPVAVETIGPDGKPVKKFVTPEIGATFPAYEKPEGPLSPLGKLDADLKAGRITPQDHAAQKLKLTTHAPAPSATVINRQETEFGKAVGRETGEIYSGLLKADMNAPATIAKYDRLGSLLKQATPGKFKGTTTDIKAAAKGLGMDLGAMGITDDVAPAQASRALSNQLALELRNPAGGAGMPGALSDKDREFLLQSIPGLENDPGAVEKMIEYRVKLAKREQQVARMARDYRRKKGTFDEGFFDQLQEWSNQNNLFPSSAPTAPWRIRPKGG